MARALLALQTTSRTGLEATYTAATADGHAFENSTQKVFLHVKNAGGSDTTITLDVIATVDGQAVADKTVVVTAGEERFIGPFSNSVYGQVNGGLSLTNAVHINASPTTSVTYAAIKLGAV